MIKNSLEQKEFNKNIFKVNSLIFNRYDILSINSLVQVYNNNTMGLTHSVFSFIHIKFFKIFAIISGLFLIRWAPEKMYWLCICWTVYTVQQYSTKIYQESLCKSNNNSLARIVRKNIESTHSKHHIVTIFGTLSSGHITQL